MQLYIICTLVLMTMAKPVLKGVVEFNVPSCCDPIIRKVTFAEKFTEPPRVLISIRALEYEGGPVGFFSAVSDITNTNFNLQLTVTQSLLKLISYEYVAVNQPEVEFGFFNVDAMGLLRLHESADQVLPTFLKFRRTFAEEPIVQVFIVGIESLTPLIQFEIAPESVTTQGVSLMMKKFGTTSVQRVQISYVATQSSKELAMKVTHTGAKQIISQQVEKTQEFLQLEQTKPKLVQINGLNGLRFQQNPVAFMWQGDQIDPTALNVNLRITLDKGNQVVLGLYYFEEKPFQMCPIVYSLCNYQGSKVYLCKDVPNFQQVMRVAKSIWMPEGASIIVYQDGLYQGAKAKITTSLECIQDWFSSVPETEVKEIETFLQINQMKTHKDLQVDDIQVDNLETYSSGFGMPVWEHQLEEILISQVSKGSTMEIEDDATRQMNTIRQETFLANSDSRRR